MAEDLGNGVEMMLAALAFAAAAAEPAQTPRTYVEQLYASYGNAKFNPLAHPGRYFASRLAAAIDEDSRLAKGEVGYLDGDPVCQCQDPAGLRATIGPVTERGPGEAIVRVSIAFPGTAARSATLTLVSTRAGWRIADISSPDEPSLVKALDASNGRQRPTH